MNNLCELQIDLIHFDQKCIDDKEIYNSISKIDVNNITYYNFFENYLLKNNACILMNASNSWPCTKTWVQNNTPNYSYLASKYINFEITTSDCNVRNFNSHQTKCFLFNEYINYWVNYKKQNYSNEMPLLYLKDWHLKKISNEDFYVVPQFFSSDWLNEYYSAKTNDDYRFVYMGPKGTWTAFHADVFTSFSWSVNICGKKRWILFPPGEEKHLKDSLGNLPYDVTKTNYEQRQFYEIYQNPGEAIFVPSGWHHQVWNLEDTISINHNWVNGCNILNMWTSLIENLNAVKKEIADCKNMDGWLEHCQLMLKTSFGLDFKIFSDLLNYIANKRIQLLSDNLEIKQFDTWILGRNHAKFDLIRIKNVLKLLIEHDDYKNLNLTEDAQELLLKINEII